MTTTELDVVQSSELTLLPPSRPPAEAARHMLLAHAEMMQTANQLAKAMVRTSMVPTRFQGDDKGGDATAAILYGAELGLNPIQSLQRVIPIHGMPSLEARTMVALLKSRGYKIRVTTQSPESVTVQGIDLDGDVFESTWTIERAKLAGYVPTPVEGSQKRPTVKEDWEGEWKSGRRGDYYVVAGNMKYITDPQAMLKAKAQSEVCRDMAPDVLLGISYTSEELLSERWDEPQQPTRQPRPAAQQQPVTVEEIFAEPQPDAEPEDAEEVPVAPASDDLPADDGVAPEPTPEPVVTRPEPAPEPKKVPAKKAAAKKTAPAAEKSQMRKALEKRLFGLIGEIDPKLTDEDRYTLYSQILDRPGITSTDDLDDHSVALIGDKLYAWQQQGRLNDEVRDALNTADLAAANAETNTQPTEGE